MKVWLSHLLRTQFIVLTLTVTSLLVTQTPAFSDPPLYVRHLNQLRITAIAEQGRVTLLDDGQGLVIDAPALNQFPQFSNGCEVTSLAMLLNYEHIAVDKLTLAAEIARAHAPLVTASDGQILSWGDPNDGFVGSMTGTKPGYGVYQAPVVALMRRYLPDDTLDLTGTHFATLLAVLRSGRPVIAWTTMTFSPDVPWVSWHSPQGVIRATMYEHAVLVVGYAGAYVLVNNPLGGIQDERVPLADFHATWVEMGRQAITVLSNR